VYFARDIDVGVSPQIPQNNIDEGDMEGIGQERFLSYQRHQARAILFLYFPPMEKA